MGKRKHWKSVGQIIPGEKARNTSHFFQPKWLTSITHKPLGMSLQRGHALAVKINYPRKKTILCMPRGGERDVKPQKNQTELKVFIAGQNKVGFVKRIQ